MIMDLEVPERNKVSMGYMKSMLKTAFHANVFDDLAGVITKMSGYSAKEYEYPNLDKVKKDDGVVAEWFYPIVDGSNGFSELTAIHQYVAQEAKFEDIGEMMLGIGIVEMHHYAKLTDLIVKLGGKVVRVYDNKAMKIGDTPAEAIEIALEGERKTIEFYEGIISRLNTNGSSKTVEAVLQLVGKIIADERVHITLLEEQLKVIQSNEM